jgi:hypothetical protein
MITPTPRLISFMINLSMPNPCPRRPHSATQNATGQRTEEVTAAYVANLDSICAAAQAKVKNEIKRSRSRTNRRSCGVGTPQPRDDARAAWGPVAEGGLLALPGTSIPAPGEVLRISGQCAASGIAGPADSADPGPRQVHLFCLTSVASQQRSGARRPEPAEAKRHYVVVVVSLLPLRVIAVYAKLKIAAPATLITHRIQSRPKVLLPPRRPHTQ